MNHITFDLKIVKSTLNGPICRFNKIVILIVMFLSLATAIFILFFMYVLNGQGWVPNKRKLKETYFACFFFWTPWLLEWRKVGIPERFSWKMVMQVLLDITVSFMHSLHSLLLLLHTFPIGNWNLYFGNSLYKMNYFHSSKCFRNCHAYP